MTRIEALTTLGFAPNANPTEAEIADAFRAAVKIHHPDRNGSAVEFDRVKQASDFFKTSDDLIDREVRALAKRHIDWAIDQILANRLDAVNSPTGVARRASSATSHFRRIADALDHVLVLLRADTDRYQREFATATLNSETFKQILAQIDLEPTTTFNKLTKEQVEARLRIVEADMAVYIRSHNVAVAVIDLVEKHKRDLAPMYNPANMTGRGP